MIKFLKNWWEVFAVAILLLVLRLFVFSPIIVDGHSMDPTLQNGERMIMLKTAKIDRFDIAVSEEPGEPKKNIIKRVIGLPEDTIEFNNDQLTINGKKYDEPYLDSYKKLWKDEKLQKEYSFDPYFQSIAQSAQAFTTTPDGKTEFSVTVPKGHYFLMGDDRLISKDSRELGPVPSSSLKGEVKLAYWPLNQFKLIK
ncbi:MAG: signal peptidase I [Lactobacillales bacterium]|jgi:signal peptidase I|nr:signal peptidase I [Lactobacillales bacterium]